MTDKFLLKNKVVFRKVKKSASQIINTGLDVCVKAEAGSSKILETLVQEGGALELQTRAYLDKQFAVARDKIEKARTKASGSLLEKIESSFDKKMSEALGRLNIPASGDFKQLNERITRLSEEVESLEAIAVGKKDANNALKKSL